MFDRSPKLKDWGGGVPARGDIGQASYERFLMAGKNGLRLAWIGGGVGGPLLSSDEQFSVQVTSGGGLEDRRFKSKIIGSWLMVPLAQTPSSPGFSPRLDRPCNSRAKETYSSSTKGDGGHRGACRRRNGMVRSTKIQSSSLMHEDQKGMSVKEESKSKVNEWRDSERISTPW